MEGKKITIAAITECSSSGIKSNYCIMNVYKI